MSDLEWKIGYQDQGLGHGNYGVLRPDGSLLVGGLDLDEAKLIVDGANSKPKIDKAIEDAIQYGQIDGDHHKTWVIDQMLRSLAGDGYKKLIEDACANEHGDAVYLWDVGIAP